MKKPDPLDPNAAARAVPARGSCLADLPLLFDHLTASVWDDGSPRERSSLTVFADAGVWKVALNNRDAGLTAFVTAETVEACLEDLEEGLFASTLPWRPSLYPRPRSAGKRP